MTSQGYVQLYERIQQILIAHNPAYLDVTRGDARDDYGSPVGTLIPRLKSVDEQSLKFVLYAEMNHWYREQAGSVEHYDLMAAEIWQAWTAFQRPVR